MTLTAIVIEDSRLAREGLVRMLDALGGLRIIGQAENARVAKALIASLRPDLLFLDVQLPGEDGFALLQQLDYQPKVIFTTAYSEYAIRSFDFRTVDYLVKPISQARLAQALQKLRDPTEPDAPSTDEDAPQFPLALNDRIFIQDGDRCHLIPVASIRWIESCKNHVRLYFGNQSAFVKRSLQSVEARLPTRSFFRINRQCIVNLQAIRAIEDAIHEGYQITLDDGRTLDVSRRSAAALKLMLSL